VGFPLELQCFLPLVQDGRKLDSLHQSCLKARYKPRLRVVHEGSDTRQATPNAEARLKLPNGRELTSAEGGGR